MNVKDWARKIVHKLPAENQGAFEDYLIGNATFAEAVTELVDELVGDAVTQKSRDAQRDDSEKLQKIRNRIRDGEDAELVVNEVCGG